MGYREQLGFGRIHEPDPLEGPLRDGTVRLKSHGNSGTVDVPRILDDHDRTVAIRLTSKRRSCDCRLSWRRAVGEIPVNSRIAGHAEGDRTVRSGRGDGFR